MNLGDAGLAHPGRFLAETMPLIKLAEISIAGNSHLCFAWTDVYFRTTGSS